MKYDREIFTSFFRIVKKSLFSVLYLYTKLLPKIDLILNTLNVFDSIHTLYLRIYIHGGRFFSLDPFESRFEYGDSDERENIDKVGSRFHAREIMARGTRNFVFNPILWPLSNVVGLYHFHYELELESNATDATINRRKLRKSNSPREDK